MSRKNRIEQLLQSELSPTHLQLVNESHKHHVPKDSETHFKLIAVSKRFEHLNRVARHRLINKLLFAEFDQGLHALSMHLYTAAEWSTAKERLSPSPSCKDGYNN